MGRGAKGRGAKGRGAKGRGAKGRGAKGRGAKGRGGGRRWHGVFAELVRRAVYLGSAPSSRSTARFSPCVIKQELRLPVV